MKSNRQRKENFPFQPILPDNHRMYPRYLMMDLLRRLYWFDEALQHELVAEGFPLTPRVQSMVLANLAIGENRPTRIARNLGVSRQAISQLLSQMEKRRLVVVRPHPKDRRARVVLFSPSSRKIRNAAQRVLATLEDELGKRVGKAKVNALREALAADWGPPRK
jgi:DNA-binding MarR family transcriptional regulator